jgi:hypothetical protein
MNTLPLTSVPSLDLIFIALVGVALVNTGLSLIVGRAARRAENRVFALVALSVALWTLTNALFRSAEDVERATLWAQLSYLAALSISATFCHFTWIYPHQARSTRLDASARFDTQASRLALYGLGILVAASTFVPGFVVQGIDLQTRSILTGRGLYLVAVFLLGTLLLAFSHLVRSQTRLRGRARAQARYVLFGTALTAAFGLFFNLWFPLWGDYRFVWIGPLCSLFFVGFSTYSIVSHRLFDVRILIRRTLVYTALLGVLAGLFAAFEKGLEHFLRPLLGKDSFGTDLLATLVVGFAIDPLKRHIHHFVTSRLFQGEAPSEDETK